MHSSCSYGGGDGTGAAAVRPGPHDARTMSDGIRPRIGRMHRSDGPIGIG
jgi:hypothetical protein